MASTRAKPGRWTLLPSLGLLVVGSAGYFSLPSDHWMFYFFAHLGALGAIGLLASSAGVLAKKKRRGYWTAFFLVAGLSTILGIVAVLAVLLVGDGQLYCGGSVSLLVALLIIVFYSLAKPPRHMRNDLVGKPL